MKYSRHVNVKCCFQCDMFAEYHCHFCHQVLCRQCKETHVIDLDTKHHHVTLYGKIIKRENCTNHPSQVYERYCESYHIPVCFNCNNHKRHKLAGFKTAYKNKRKQAEECIVNMRIEINKIQILLASFATDYGLCKKKICRLQHFMLTKSIKLNIVMDDVPGIMSKKYKMLLNERFQYQQIRINRFIARIQDFKQRCFQVLNRPTKFLQFLKKARFPQIRDTPQLAQEYMFSLNCGFDMMNLIVLLTTMQFTEGEKRQTGNEKLLKLMTSPVLRKSLTLTDNNGCGHISCVTPEKVCFGFRDAIYMVDTTTGKISHELTALGSGGIFTVSSSGELIVLDITYNIIKWSNNMKTNKIFKRSNGLPWKPSCLYYSSYTCDLLVGMYKRDVDTKTETGKIVRYNIKRDLEQTILDDDTGHNMFYYPRYLTENTNRDVVVSDNYAVVVANYTGKHRFSYKGPSSESGIEPRGICTDVLSRILVCDLKTHSIQIIDKDGQFLSCLEHSKIYRPYCLCYDLDTHLLWVGSLHSNKVVVYRYITRQLDLKGMSIQC